MLRRGWFPVFPLALALALAWLAPGGAPRASAAGNPFVVDRWENDLPQNSVITLTQTRDGYLWLGTLGGLVRFDGLRFEVFDEGNTPELKSSRILRLFEDSRGRLWIGTANAGIAVLAHGRITGTGLGRGGHLAAACEDDAGTVWLYNSDGQLWRVTATTTNSAPFLRDQFSVERIGPSRFVVAERGGQIWAAAGPRVASRTPDDTGAWQETLFGPRIEYLLASRTGGHWRLAGGRIQKWNGSRLERELGNGYPWRNAAISSACEDLEGNLIVGTLGAGVFWFDAAGRATPLSSEEGLGYTFVLSLQVDREGSLWVGTDGGGLCRVRRRSFQVLEPTRGLVVQSVCEAADAGLWLGFNSIDPNASGVGLWQDGGFKAVFGRDRGLRYSVRSVYVDRAGTTWAGTLGEFFQYQNGQFVSVRVDNAPHTLVTGIHEDRAGRLWVGSEGGLAFLKDQAWTAVLPQPGHAPGIIQAITDDAETNIWVGTELGGLLRWRDGQFTVFRKSPDGLPSDNISALWADREGVLWVGTEGGGLARFHRNRWTRYTSREGLAGNAIGYLLEDGEGHLWIGSSSGLMRVAKRDLNDFALGRTGNLNCRAYGTAEGLPSRECSRGSQPAAWRGRDGRLWFATIQGLASVDPAQIRPNTNPPPIVIESVRIEGRASEERRLPGTAARAVTVPAGKQRIEIQYTSLNLAAPKRARFQYRLEGHETRWTDAGDTRTVSFFKLEPGHYRFQVTACNEDGVWNPVPAQIAITVLPPFWRTWWFLTATVAVLLGLVIATVHVISTQRLNRQLAVLRQQEALERERARIARDIHDQLGANLTQVALLGELVEADKNSPPDIEDHARQICQTARDTTRSLDEIVWTVNPANDTLEGLANYLCKYAQEYLAVAGLRCRLEVPAQLPAASINPDVRHNVFLAAREAVTNIVRHARASSAWLRLKLEPGRFTFEIEDDGRGPGDIDSERAKTRNGLRNMARRMEDVGGSFHIGPGPERGTIIRLSAPLVPK